MCKKVDPYNTITNLAKIESRLKQLADPIVSYNDEDMERVAKKAMIADGTAKTAAEEYEEYRAAKAEYIRKPEEL